MSNAVKDFASLYETAAHLRDFMDNYRFNPELFLAKDEGAV
ncbi:hypothetical protein OR573_03545 [Halomonas sp. CH40]